MIYPKIKVLGLEEVKRLRKPGVDFLLSILSPDDMLLPPTWIARDKYLALTFADISDKEGGSDIFVPPAKEDVQAILEFGSKVIEAQKEQEEPLELLIHCTAGISRSTAAAYSVWCDWLGEGKEKEALEAVLAVRPAAMPNRLIVSYADELLGRNGEMIRQLADKFNYPQA